MVIKIRLVNVNASTKIKIDKITPNILVSLLPITANMSGDAYRIRWLGSKYNPDGLFVGAFCSVEYKSNPNDAKHNHK